MASKQVGPSAWVHVDDEPEDDEIEVWGMLRQLTDGMNQDEFDVWLETAQLCARRINIGRTRYGELNLVSDMRDLMRDVEEEMSDGLIYAACHKVREGRRKERWEGEGE